MVTIQIGQVATLKRSFSQEEFDRFADLSGDDNPIHVDPGFAARTRFGKPVAHGMMLYATICRVLSTQLPGPGTLQIEQEMVFRHPTFADTEITVQFEVIRVQPKEHKAEIRTAIHLPDDNMACDGRTVVHLPGWKGGFSGIRDRMAMAGDTEAPILGNLEVGQSASIRRTFTAGDMAEYADLTGDTNPLFTDPDQARRAGFKGCIIPGPLLSGMFSCLLGTRLPGRGTNWLKQELHYPAPAMVGDEITAKVEITRLRPDKNLVDLWDTCTNSSGELVCQARSLVLVKDLEK